MTPEEIIKAGNTLGALGTISNALAVGQYARSHYGNMAQDTMLFEECGELVSACGKLIAKLAQNMRGRHSRKEVDEEIADVLFVTLGAVNTNVLAHLQCKIERLKERMSE